MISLGTRNSCAKSPTEPPFGHSTQDPQPEEGFRQKGAKASCREKGEGQEKGRRKEEERQS
jgi:hypothetical protein